MDGFSLGRIIKHPLCLVALSLGLLDHGRIHLGVFVRLPRNRRPKIFGGGPDAVQRAQMPLGVDPLRLRGGIEQLGDVAEAFFLRFLGEGPVFLERLAFAGDGDAFLESRINKRRIGSNNAIQAETMNSAEE